MKNKLYIGIAGIFLSFLFFNSCKKNKETAAQLTISNITDTIPMEGGTKSLTFTCNASWSIDTTGFKWLQLNTINGNSGNDTIQLTAPANSSGVRRSLILTIVSTNGQERRITVLQMPQIYPSYNTLPIATDGTGMSSTATQLAAKFKLGINIGNTMEAPGGETGWGNPVITQLLIDSLKQAGFTSIRIPCNWDYTHIINKATEQIDPAWLSRVQEVVQYCVNDGMYVELNIHWDGGWLDCNATGVNLDTVYAKQKALWEQIATTMRDFDEHLMLASANEPYSNTSNFSFTLPTVTNLYNFHQTFINAVRSTGGKNAYRTLVIQAPVTSGDLADYFTPGGLPGMPSDNVPNKLMLEFHYYSPFNFCLKQKDDASGLDWYYWGANYHSTTDLKRNATSGTEETYVDGVFSLLQKEFSDKGIPVLVGEMGAFNKQALDSLTGDALKLHLASRGHWYSYVAHSALTHGALPFIWDTGEILNRNTGAVQNKQLLDSLNYGASH